MTDVRLDLPVVRNSEKTKFWDCHMAWWWAYVERLRIIGSASAALTFGDLIHQALAAHYVSETEKKRRRGPHPLETFRILHRELVLNGSKYGFKIRERDEEAWEDAPAMAEYMLNEYVKKYGDERGRCDMQWLILAPEMSFQTPILDVKGVQIGTSVGQGDLVFRNLGASGRWQRIGMVDHKTAASLKTSHLWNIEQAIHYITYLPPFLREKGLMAKDEEIDHIVWNLLRKTAKDERPQNEEGLYLNQNGTVSKQQPGPLFHREIMTRGEAERRHCRNRTRATLREMELYRSGKLNIYKMPGDHCAWCEFKEMCELHEIDGDWEGFKEEMFTTWDPFEAHRDELVAETSTKVLTGVKK